MVIVAPTIRGEFAEIMKTRFWNEYSDRLEKNRQQVVAQLLSVDTDLGKPMCYGAVLQRILWFLDRIVAIPEKMMGES